MPDDVRVELRDKRTTILEKSLSAIREIAIVMTKKLNESTKNITDTLGYLLRHHLTAFYDWESLDKAMEGIRASQVFRLSI